jgi:hypothetical protein
MRLASVRDSAWSSVENKATPKLPLLEEVDFPNMIDPVWLVTGTPHEFSREQGNTEAPFSDAVIFPNMM